MNIFSVTLLLVREKSRALIVVFVFTLFGFNSFLFAQQAQNTSEQKPPDTADQKVKNERKIEEPALIETGGVLLPKGTLIVEPAFQYTHSVSHTLSLSGFTLFQVINVGTFQVEDVERDIYMPSLTFRYGVFNPLQVAIKIPWLFRNDKFFFNDQEGKNYRNPPVEYSVSDDNLGDIEGAVNLKLFSETELFPDVIANMKAKSITGKSPYGLDTVTFAGTKRPKELPSGTGHWGLGGGVTFVKSSDPAVLFINIDYFYNFERDLSDIGFGEIKPGNSIEYSLGMAYALNEKLSTSISFQHRKTFATTQEGVKIIGSDSNAASLFFGVSYATSQNSSISVNVGSGLTNDAPNLNVSVILPIRFSL